MKLMQWMHILRRQSGQSHAEDEPSTPVAARRTDAAAILRLVSNTLNELGPDLTVRDMTDPRPEDLLEQVEGSGYDLGLPHVQHTAGQMRVLLAAARAGQVRVDRATVDSMRQAIRYLGQHLMKGKRFPRQPEALVHWNRRFQAVMATAEPADIFAPQPDFEEQPLPVIAVPQERPALVMPSKMDPDEAIDAAVAAARDLFPPLPRDEEIDEQIAEPVQEEVPVEIAFSEPEPEPEDTEESAEFAPMAMVTVEPVQEPIRATDPPRHPVPTEPIRLPSRRLIRPARVTRVDEAVPVAATFRMPPRTKPLADDIEFDVEELERLMHSRRKRPNVVRR